MLPPRLRWKLRIIAQQLEGQLDYWKNLWRGTRVTTRMCPSCRALVGVMESVCSLCGAKLRRRPSGLGKLLTNILPQYTPVSYGLLTANFSRFPGHVRCGAEGDGHRFRPSCNRRKPSGPGDMGSRRGPAGSPGGMVASGICHFYPTSALSTCCSTPTL